VKIWFFYKKFKKRENNTSWPCPYAGHVGQKLKMRHAQGVWPRVEGRMRQPLLCVFNSFWSFLPRSSFLRFLETWDEFLLHCIMFKKLLRTIVFNLHILCLSCDVLIYRFTWFLTTKRLKHLWSCIIYDNSNYKWFEWKQYK